MWESDFLKILAIKILQNILAFTEIKLFCLAVFSSTEDRLPKIQKSRGTACYTPFPGSPTLNIDEHRLLNEIEA